MLMRNAPTVHAGPHPAASAEQTVRPADWRIFRARRYQAISDVPISNKHEIALEMVSDGGAHAEATITELGHVLECDDSAAHEWLLDKTNEVDEVILFGPREHPCDACGALTQATFVDPEDVALLGWLCRSCEPEIAEQKRS